MSDDLVKAELEERGVTNRRIRRSQDHTEEGRTALGRRGRSLARAVYDDFGQVLREEVDEEGGVVRRRDAEVDQCRAAYYAALDEQDSQTSPEAVREGLRGWIESFAPAGPVLDLGTGIGANLRILNSGGRRAVGTDISLAPARTAASVASVAVADGAHLPFPDGVFGSLVCTEVLEHVDDPKTVLTEAARVLRPGGLAYVTAPNYANLAGLHKWLADRRSGGHDWNPWGAHQGGYEAFMTGRMLLRAARPHFELVRARGIDFGQALTGRFPALDRLAWTRAAQAVLRWVLPRLERSPRRLLSWHGMHIELVLRRPH
ncbi:MAG TPA: class I SAM-dependent methyltransferase [Acidimicrobiales bacterium]|nr:class I SAM-dependent methyltransferase [Acidimicrobiales bacterium]